MGEDGQDRSMNVVWCLDAAAVRVRNMALIRPTPPHVIAGNYRCNYVHPCCTVCTNGRLDAARYPHDARSRRVECLVSFAIDGPTSRTKSPLVSYGRI